MGVIHRDLKPQNIMRDSSGRILVMDFGLARTLEGDGMTQTGALVGTMEYMSPEQALAKDLDQRSDLFTLGLILYELLTGVTPFRADSAMASLLRRTSERAIPVSDHDGTIPPNSATLSASAWSATPISATRMPANCCVIWTPGKAIARARPWAFSRPSSLGAAPSTGRC